MMRYVTPVIALLLALVSFGGAYYLYADIEKSAVLIETSHDQVAAITARDTFAKSAAAFLAETTAERNAIQFFLIPSDGTALAIELVEAAGKLAGVKASVGSATIGSLGAQHERLDISVSAEGTYAGLARFATVLESLPRASTLKQVDISQTEKGWYGTYAVTFVKLK
jgi:hypothetical protein